VIYVSPLFGALTLELADPLPENTGLFSHFVWNAAVQLAALIEGPEPAPPEGAIEQVKVQQEEEEGSQTEGLEWEVDGRQVLELGAGTGLAGLVATLKGAARVVITDYPAPEVLDNLRKNVAKNIDTRQTGKDDAGKEEAKMELGDVSVEGHEWGVLTDSFSIREKESFDRILVADCLWSMFSPFIFTSLKEKHAGRYTDLGQCHINIKTFLRVFAGFLRRRGGLGSWQVSILGERR